MRIAILVEGKTEKAFKPYLLLYLERRLAGKMPKLDFMPHDGRIPTGDKLKRRVENLLNDRTRPADAVIALPQKIVVAGLVGVKGFLHPVRSGSSIKIVDGIIVAVDRTH